MSSVRILSKEETDMKPQLNNNVIIFAAILLIWAVFTMTSYAASQIGGSVSEELVTLTPRAGVTQKLVLIAPENPVAAVVLLEGGPGKIEAGGSPNNPSVKADKGFLARNRNNFASYGLTVALVDASSDVPSKGMNPMIRISAQHAQDLEHVIQHLRQTQGLPVWVVGVSMGGFSAVNAAIQVGDNIQGLVLLSVLTQSRSGSALTRSVPNGILDMDLDQIQVPTFVVAHEDDACYDTPPSGASKIEDSLTNAQEVVVRIFSGGKKARSDACGPAAPHTFYGLDDEVVAAIAAFIASHSQ
jgi:dienelactone hydrolase